MFLSLHLLPEKYQFLVSLSMFRTWASFILSNTFEYCKCILPVVRELAAAPSQIHKFCAQIIFHSFPNATAQKATASCLNALLSDSKEKLELREFATHVRALSK